jgi:DNA-binding MarR family transcriptional regulator
MTPTPRRDSIDRFIETALPLFPMLDPEVEAAVDRMTKIVKHIDRLTERTVSQFGLNTGEFRLLLKLRQAPEQRATAGELAERLSLSTGAMTNRLDQLEEAGLIERTRDPADRRSVQVTITGKGIDVLAQAVDAQADEEKRIVGSLSRQDQVRLNGLLRQLMLAVEDAKADLGFKPV